MNLISVTFGSKDEAQASTSSAVLAPVVKPSEGVKSPGTHPAPTGHVDDKASILTTLAPRNPAPFPAKSAWSKGPPQSATTPSPRSQSPAPSNQIIQTHSRRSSTLGKAVWVKDGVSVPKRNVGALKQGLTVTFGSIDDAPLPAPVVKPSEGEKFFGTLPAAPTGHVNGKASISSRSSVLASGASSTISTPTSSIVSATTAPTTTSSPAPPDPTSSKVHLDVKKLFQETTPPSSDTSPPAVRNTSQIFSHQPLGPHTHNSQAPSLPLPQMPMQPTTSMWPQPYYYPDQYNMYWYPTMPMQTHPQHPAPPQRSPSPSTPSSTIPPSKTLNAASSSLVLRKSVSASLRTPDGVELDFENRRNGANSTIWIETEERHAQLVAEEEQKEREEASVRVCSEQEERMKEESLRREADELQVRRMHKSALAAARFISNIHSVPYPEGVSSPNPALNQNAKEGIFRYDREFLLQFMSICKEKPASLPPLDAIGIEPIDPSSLMRGGSGRHRTASAALPPARQASIGLGYSSSSMGKGIDSFNPMGNFATGGANKLTSEDRFVASSRATSVSGAVGTQFARPMPLTRTASIGGPTATRKRTRSKRGEKRNESNKLANAAQIQATTTALHHQQANFEPVVPLQATANRWDRKTFQFDGDSPEMVERKVKALLNKLTMEKFDSISDQIISWANKSENEKDGRTLIQVIKLVFEKATDEATWSEMYARLCRKMMEQISPKVQDDGIKNSEGKPITGGQLFRKYLLNRCQEDFERGWVAKEATAAAAASKAIEDEAVKATNGYAFYSYKYYAAQKAKQRGLGLINFMGELFKLQMLTERIVHECVKKLLGNVDIPEEEEIKSLCKLLTTVGGLLDTQKARAHMDVYFYRMKELTKSPHVTSRMQYMLQDVIELRDCKWTARQSRFRRSHYYCSAAAKEKVAQAKEASK